MSTPTIYVVLDLLAELGRLSLEEEGPAEEQIRPAEEGDQP